VPPDFGKSIRSHLSLISCGLICAGLSQTDAHATSIFVDENNTVPGQNILDQRQGCRISGMPPDFDVRDRIPMKTGLRRVRSKDAGRSEL
jgi:hypothetical protein